jgi:hypothetical protein
MTEFYIDTKKIITNTISPEKITIEADDDGFGCHIVLKVDPTDKQPSELWLGPEQAFLLGQELVKMFSNGKKASETIPQDKIFTREI